MSPSPAVPARALVLWANESSPNLGVAALARGSRDLLRRVNPEMLFEFANYGAKPTAVPWGRPRSLVRERVQARYGMQDYFAGFDLVWDTRSGDSFSDIYGLGRHLTMSLVHEFATQAGAPVLMAPQTIGPFGSRRARILARRTLSRSARVFARDPQSASAAQRLGHTPDLTSADLVFAIDPIEAPVRRDVLLNISGLLWNTNPHVDAGAYRRVVIDLGRRLRADGRSVTLLAHVLDSPVPDNDVPAITEAARAIGGDLEIVVPADLDDVRRAIAGSRVVIASRMHACLNALSLGVPAVPLAYSRKFAPLLQSVGWNVNFDLRSEDASTLAARVEATTAGVDREVAAEAARAGRRSLDAVVESVRALFAV